MPPRRSTQNNQRETEEQQPDMAQVIAQQISAAIPNIVAQVTAGIQTNQRNVSGANANRRQDALGIFVNDGRECSYKYFMACKPKEFHGTEGAVGLLKWLDSVESVLHVSNCAAEHKVGYVSSLLQDVALIWWNTQVQTKGREAAYNLSWETFKKSLIEQFCPKNEVQKLEAELWNHAMQGAEIEKYTTRFHELAKLVPHLVTPEYNRIDRYIWGLAPELRGMVTSSNPTTIEGAVILAHRLTTDLVRSGILSKGSSGSKRKSESQSGEKSGNATNKNQKSARNFAITTQEPKGYIGTSPKCNKCKYHHVGACPRCEVCKEVGHYAKYCKVGKDRKAEGEGRKSCYECGSLDHFRNTCPKLGRGPNVNADQNQAGPATQGNQGGQTRGRVFVMEEEEAH